MDLKDEVRMAIQPNPKFSERLTLYGRIESAEPGALRYEKLKAWMKKPTTSSAEIIRLCFLDDEFDLVVDRLPEPTQVEEGNEDT